MTTENQAGGAGDNSTGGAGGEGSGGQAGEGQQGGDGKPVAWADHKRALDDLHRFKGQAKTSADKLTALEAEIADLKKQGLQSSSDYKKLWELEQAAKAKVEEKAGNLEKAVKYGERYRAVLPKLKEAGLRDDALNLLELETLEEVELEATSKGRFVAHGIDTFVEAFKGKYPYAFQAKKAPNVNSGGGRQPPGKGEWTPDKLYALEVECKKKGDMAPYRAAVAEWQEARRKKA